MNSAMVVSESSFSSTPRATTATASAHFHDLDELLLGPTDLEAMPFEFGCDFASAFEDKHLEVDAPGPVHCQSNSHAATLSTSEPRVREGKPRSHKRKSDGISSSSASRVASAVTVSSPPIVLDNENDDLSSLDPKSGDNGSTQIGRWTKKEHELFLEGLRLYGKSWKKISSLVVTRTLVQIRTHAQKYLQKQNKSAMKAAAAAAAAASGTTVTATSASSKSRKMQSHLLDEDALPAAWKHSSHHSQSQRQGHTHSPASLFRPIAFPDYASSSSSSAPHGSHSLSISSSSSSVAPSSSFQLRKELASHSSISNSSTMSKLDQLLHDESHTNQDDYYSSPTGSDEDLVQWLQHRHLPTFVNSPAPKRRRTDAVKAGSSSSPWAIVNPMEAMTSSYPSFYTSQNQSSSASSSHSLNGDFLPPLSAYAASSSSAVAPHSDSEFSFGHSWLS